MNVESQIVLDEFVLRHYQAPIRKALQEGKRRIIAILPRRAGKDLCCWNLLIREAIKKPAIYWMIYPTYSMGRKILWDGLTNDGKSFISYIPKELIKSIHQQEMKIRLINESVIQIQGSDSPDRLVGANCYGAVFSEYALQDPIVYQQIIRPMLTANGGFAIFISTPRGKGGNGLWELWNIAQSNKEHWFSYIMTVEETKHIDLAEIHRQIQSGEMEEGLAKQEWWCSFDRGIEGSFYGAYLDKARLQNRIGHVPHEPGLLVYTSWDIGVRDATTIIWYQIAGQTIRIINCYSNHSLGLDHYIEKIFEEQKKYGYKYSKHFAPADIRVREFGAGAITRFEQARQLGIIFTVLEQIGLQEGINNVWMNFHKFYLDDVMCKTLIDALENYRREWDEQRKVHNPKPLHNWASNYADSLRYLVQSLSLCSLRSSTPEQLQNRFLESKYGSDMSHMPIIFRQERENPPYFYRGIINKQLVLEN
jgi:phage terminase large subunit